MTTAGYIPAMGGGGGPPTGAASGDLGASYPGPTVVALQSATTRIAVNGAVAPVAGQVMTATSPTVAGWATPTATTRGLVTNLVDGATPALDASLSVFFSLAAAGDRTIAVPSNPPSVLQSQFINIAHTAVGAPRTLALNTGAGGFRFGADIPLLTVTAAGATDRVTCQWDPVDSRWDIIAYVKGFV